VIRGRSNVQPFNRSNAGENSFEPFNPPEPYGATGCAPRLYAPRPARRRGAREQEAVELNPKAPVRAERNKSKKQFARLESLAPLSFP